MRAFAETLKELRIERGLTQKELACQIGYSKAIIGFWENGKSEPTASALVALANFFNCSIDYLIGLDERFDLTENQKHLRQNDLEKRVVDDFNYLDEYAKEQVYIFLDTLVEAQKRRENSNNNFTRKYNKT